jgi:diguanylate cyclase (GGDEF)-like protein/PAS domain S-box-containing protein
MSACFVAQSLGLVPDAERAVLAGRRVLCETVAIQCSLAAQKEDHSALRTTIQALVFRNKDILSAAVRRKNGKLLAVAGDHERQWNNRESEKSTPDEVLVPIRQGKTPWGQVEIRFAPLVRTGWRGVLMHPLLRLTTFVTLLAFLTYAWYLKKTLTHLDPSAAIPDRVRETLDTLAEGVLVLDKQQRILLANKAFAHNTGRSVGALQGFKAQEIPWDDAESNTASKDLPWTRAIREGKSQTGVMLRLAEGGSGTRTFMVNSSPIIGGDGRQRGVLATFDDVTPIEKKNQQLEEMLTDLKTSRDEIHRKNEELTLLATRDPLTSCLNRRAFFNSFETEWTTARSRNQPLSCIMVDIDHFKSVNDTHGHSAGDVVLQEISAILRTGARPTDVVCRYGGEEFCVLLPQTGVAEANAVAERLRQMIAVQQCGPLHVTASMGISALEFGAKDPRELLDQADKSLYVSKRSGRNRVTRWSDVPKDVVVDSPESASQNHEVDVDVPIPFHAVTALSSALAFRDTLTAEHSRRVADLCVATAQGLMSERQCYVLEVAALLHDIGKLGVPDAILLKPGPLTEDEWKVMSTHDRIGVEIISAAFSSPDLTAIVRAHHGWFGGNPRSPALPKGEDLPLGARILTIADAFDAMVSDRVYRKGCDRAKAFEELRRCAGTQFDPAIVERFIEAVSSSDQSRNQRFLVVTKPTALRIGVQIERLATAIDAQDFPALSVMAGRLAATAQEEGVGAIAELAADLERSAASEPDLVHIVGLTANLLELCRATQSSYIALAAEPELEMAGEAR